MSWLGNGFREQAQALSDAYASMYAPKEEEQVEEGLNPFKPKSPIDKLKELDRLTKQAKDPFADTSIKKEEQEILDSLQDAYAMMYEKKKDSDKCGEDTYWDKEEKKCKSKKKSSKTVVVGRGGIYGPGYHGGGGSGGDNGGDGETDGGDGGDGGGGDGGGGGE